MLDSACARPSGATALRVTAYAPSGEASRAAELGGTIDLDDLPGDTEQIGLELLVGNGAVGASGKSAPLAFADLPDGAAIPIAMAPPNGLCLVGALTEPRAQPLLARAGDGALVVGGTGPDGPLATAEFYDPATATFSAVAVPEVFLESPLGASGMALATLPDGRVALTGGPSSSITLFDPATRSFGAPITVEPRRFHAALAIAPDQVLVAGGCASLVDAGCVAPRQTTRVFDLDMLGAPAFGPQLPPGASRVRATLFDTGVQLDGLRRYVLAGGDAAGASASRFALGDAMAADATGTGPIVAPLDGGAVLGAFAPQPDPITGMYAGTAASSILGPSASGAIAGGTIPGHARELEGLRLVALEDGRVVGFGGAADGSLVSYDPATNAWTRRAPACAAEPGACEAPGPMSSTAALVAPSLLRLADGSVLVAGGAVSTSAWLYRPPTQVGARSGSVTALPARDDSIGALTAPAPETVSRADSYELASPGDALVARALVGGPRGATGSVRATLHVRAGGVALIAQQRGPGEYVAALLAPGEVVRLVRVAAGRQDVLCQGNPVPAFVADAPVTLRLALSGHDARVTLDDDQALLACSVELGDAGQWGVAALGAGARVAVDAVTAARS